MAAQRLSEEWNELKPFSLFSLYYDTSITPKHTKLKISFSKFAKVSKMLAEECSKNTRSY